MLAFELSPTLQMPYLGDDTFNAYLDGWRGYEHLSLAAADGKLFDATNISVGRFYPVYPLLLLFDFHVVHGVFALKTLVLLAILCNAYTFYRVVRICAPACALPSLVSLCALLQIRFFHDAIVQFSLHMQLALEFSLLATACILADRRRPSAGTMAACVVCYLCAALTYEATYAYVAVIVVLVWSGGTPARRAVTASIAFACVPLALSAVAIAIRTHVAVPATSPYAVHAEPGKVAETFALQTLGALPLSYALFDPDRFMPRLPALFTTIPTVLSTAVTAGLAFAILRRERSSSRIGVAPLIAIALLAVAASASLISLSPRWQAELRPGLAYTPVYFEYFGLALAAGAALAWIGAKRTPALAAGASLALGVCTGATCAANRAALAHYYVWTPIVPDALDSGVLEDVRDGDVVYTDAAYPAENQLGGDRWDARYFFYAHGGRRVTAANVDRLPVSKPPHADVLLASIRGFADGRVAAGPIAATEIVGGHSFALVTSARTYSIDSGGIRASSWTSHCGAVPLENVLDGNFAGPALRFSDAFYAPERDGASNFRWASRAGTIAIINGSERPREVEIRFAIRTARYPATIAVRGAGRTIERRATSDQRYGFTFDVAAKKTETIEVETGNAPIDKNPGGRTLRFQIRDLALRETACGRPIARQREN